MTLRFDAIIVGTGQSGPPLATRLARAGMQVAVIERKLFGGTCVNTGCTPTKSLIASARVAYLARRAADFGVEIDAPVRVDMERVKARKDAIVAPSNKGIEEKLEDLENCTVFHEHAAFEGPKRLRVGETTLEADKIFIDVGARARVPDVPGIETVPYLTNSSMMDVDFLPQHLVLLGGSYVGLEFAQMYRRFGSQVTVIEKGPRLIPKEDEDVSQAVREILEDEGIWVITDAPDFSASNQNGQILFSATRDRQSVEIAGSHLLIGAGRMPNTDDLGLDKAGIETDEHGYIKVDDQLRTIVDGIWAMGDCNGRGAFTHTSYNDYEIVAANLLDGDPRRVSDRIMAYALYIDPPLGRGGMTEHQVRESGRKALIAKLPMSGVARARERSETKGFMKILVDAETERLLGAALLGIRGDEVIHTLLDVMYADAPYTVIERAMHIHPTVAELIPTMLSDLKPLD